MTNNNQSNQFSIITLFDNNANNRIRTINRKGNAWYVAADVLYILGFAVSKRGSILKDAPEIKTVLNSSEKSIYTQTKRGGSVSKFTIISESGLYKLIMRSNKPVAKPFQDWVAGELRRNCQYGQV